MGDDLRSIVLGTTGLLVVALISVWLTAFRVESPATAEARKKLQVVAALVIGVQVAHFGEELIGGFQTQFPEILGLTEWSLEFFVGFNLFWIVVWVLAVAVIGRRIRGALFPVWFLAVASALNGIAHPMLTITDGGYFPGLLTSPLSGIAGIVLLRQLTAFTEGRSTSLSA